MAKSKHPDIADQQITKPAKRLPRTEASANNQIRNWRMFKGIGTQKELAALTVPFDPAGIGVSRAVIVRLENGEYRYNEDHLILIGKALGVDPRDLVGTNPFDSGDIFTIYAGFTAHQKRRLLGIAKQMQRKPPKA